MNPGFDIMFPTPNDIARVRREYEKVEKRYLEKGYALPVYALQLVKETYNDQYARENRQAEKQGKDVSALRESRMDLLQSLTCTKLLNCAMQVFKQDPEACFELEFERGRTTEETADFFNLRNKTGEYVNICRTGEIALPKSFSHGGKTNDMCFKIFSNGEQVVCNNNGQEEIVCDSVHMPNFVDYASEPEQ